LYYICKDLNIQKGIINIIISNKLKKGQIIRGIIGPNFDNVANYYLFDFICKGNNRHYLKCLIVNKNKDKLLYKGNYLIYSLENYSFNPEKLEIFLYNEKKEKYIFFFYIILILKYRDIFLSLIFFYK
jgi:hypothetical protein